MGPMGIMGLKELMAPRKRKTAMLLGSIAVLKN